MTSASSLSHHLFCRRELAIPLECPHLYPYKSDASFHQSLLLSIRYAAAISSAIPPEQTVSEKLPVCSGCRSTAMNRFHACLSCVNFSCWNCNAVETHFKASNHALWIDVRRMEIYCASCKDYVYDAELNARIQTVISNQLSTINNKLETELRSPQGYHRIKRRREDKTELTTFCGSWTPSSTEVDCVRKYTVKEKAEGIIGLRGLNNLGNTCFMNCILQACVHNPPLRNYFLADGHNRHKCTRKSEAPVCLGCEMDELTTQMFSGESSPFNPHTFLYATWVSSERLSGYAQQDAHEFLISTLNEIHESCSERRESDCRCVIHKLFNGIMRSDLRCNNCSSVSTVFDPFFDISLDIQGTLQHTGSADISLLQCLKTFTAMERLESDQPCSKCGAQRQGTKQLSLEQFPRILVVHLKRFDHVARNAHKIDRFVSFKTLLDLAPFHANQLSRRLSSGGNDVVVNAVPHWYELYAVISHQGSLDVGHYTTFLRQGSQWFKCDDALITVANEQDVFSSEAYLLFYTHKTR